MMLHNERIPSRGEEVANSVSHGMGLLLAAAAVPFLLVTSVRNGSAVNVAASSVFALTMVLVYASSALYHAITHEGAKRLFGYYVPAPGVEPPAAAELRRVMRLRGVQRVPRGPRPTTRANRFGLTTRQLEILGRFDGDNASAAGALVDRLQRDETVTDRRAGEGRPPRRSGPAPSAASGQPSGPRRRSCRGRPRRRTSGRGGRTPTGAPRR